MDPGYLSIAIYGNAVPSNPFPSSGAPIIYSQYFHPTLAPPALCSRQKPLPDIPHDHYPPCPANCVHVHQPDASSYPPSMFYRLPWTQHEVSWLEIPDFLVTVSSALVERTISMSVFSLRYAGGMTCPGLVAFLRFPAPGGVGKTSFVVSLKVNEIGQ